MKISRVDPLPKELDVQIILSSEEAKILKAMAMASENYTTYIINTYNRISGNGLDSNGIKGFIASLKQGLYNEGV